MGLNQCHVISFVNLRRSDSDTKAALIDCFANMEFQVIVVVLIIHTVFYAVTMRNQRWIYKPHSRQKLIVDMQMVSEKRYSQNGFIETVSRKWYLENGIPKTVS